MEYLILGAIVLLFYFAPTFVASGRAHTSTTAIFVFNLLLAWTVIGWIIALVWAYSGENVAETRKKEQRAAEEAARMAKTEEATLRKCPACAELIKREAVKCRFCGTDVDPLPISVLPPKVR